ncbi:MAG TPA: B-box zinc finger protein [Terriglobales bacterium]|nr:B-box zinc finger protein [Terriglobales bacterium]
MNCTVHPETPATAYCRTCGKAMCAQCQRTVHGVIYCEDCLASRVSGATVTPVAVAPVGGASPVLAAMLGFIPGVGAMFNGQFIKGLIHAGVFAALVAIETMNPPDALAAIVGLGIGFWVFYQVIDAYKTARARMYGLPGPDPFGIERTFGGGTPPPVAVAPMAPPMTSGAPGYVPQPVVPVYVPPPQETRQPSPVGAVILIGLGVLFLLNTMGWWHFHWIGRMWPLILIALGIWLFVRRFDACQQTTPTTTTTTPPEQQ